MAEAIAYFILGAVATGVAWYIHVGNIKKKNSSNNSGGGGSNSGDSNVGRA